MTQDVDILSPAADVLAKDPRDHLHCTFLVDVQIREPHEKRNYRLFQVAKPSNRHLVDIRSVSSLPTLQRVGRVPVLTPVELIVSKVKALAQRQGQPKSSTDWLDVALLLLGFPELKASEGTVRDRLGDEKAFRQVIEAWESFVALNLHPEDESEPGDW